VDLTSERLSFLHKVARRRGAAGASDMDIHDAAIITAAFFMFNRYVEGLGTRAAKEREYELIGRRLRDNGYAPARG
jgi:hypothetical protein